MKVRRIGFRPDIQALRAIAVLLVVIYHAGVPWLSGGYIGVDVFFVISGFLITAHLASELSTHGRIRFATFYARRIRRILPTSLVVVALSVVAAAIWIPPLLQSRSFKESVFTALYVPNFYFAGEKVDYLSNPNPSIFQHFWSLGVEEQFYLIWPAAIALVFFLTRKSTWGLIATLGTVFVIGLVGSIWLTERSQPLAFFMMPSRAWEFALGGLLALLVTATSFALAPAVRWLIGWVGVVSLVVCGVVYDGATIFPGTAAIVPVVGTVLVIAAGSRVDDTESVLDRTSATGLLSNRPMIFIGTISYSLYLVHWPLLTIPQIAVGDQRPLSPVVTLALAAAGIPLAWLLYRYIETPLRVSRDKSWPTIVIAAGVTVCLVLACGVTYRGSLDRQFHTDRNVAVSAPSTRVKATQFVPANMTPTVKDASDDNPDVYSEGCHLSDGESTVDECRVETNADAPTVMLFGDSHAAQWYPALQALAERGDITLVSNTKSNCAAYDVPSSNECRTWRANVVRAIGDEQPELTIIAGYVGATGTQLPPDTWGRDVGKGIESLTSATNVAVMIDNPQFGMDPATCLSANINNATACGAPPNQALFADHGEAMRQAAQAHDATVLDMTDYLCSDDLCPVVIGDRLVYRDAHHISATYSRALADAVWTQIEPALGA
ncbi:acyltransferase family protein [Microbacterium sp. MPKO10]|uniref:acyltransferase family protein n=1 Tax=Microbacterium sp. MPKO10 TaxID=2989818 RepID=UPI002235F846|nr:acyltransferase family protein [Microbacterium sp. MPKO10]MCW4457801.1 acyltransferase [Microbacterium sp. MPKO10]